MLSPKFMDSYYMTYSKKTNAVIFAQNFGQYFKRGTWAKWTMFRGNLRKETPHKA
jgi:hypothetical protein